MQGKVSIVIPVYNRLSFLGATLESVQLQSHDNLEIIVVDDSSQEDVRSFVEARTALDGRIRYALLSPNGGIGAARAYGASLASGEFLQFLDSDDLLHVEKLRVQVEALNTEPELDFIACQTLSFMIQPGDGPTLWNTFKGDSPLMKLCKGQVPWQIGALLARRSAYESLGGFKSDLRWGEDRELMLHWLSKDSKYRQDSYPMVFYRTHQTLRASHLGWGNPTLGSARSLVAARDRLSERGALDEELRREIATSLVRHAQRHDAAGQPKEAAEVLRMAAESAAEGQNPEACRTAADRLTEGLADAATFDALRAAGFDWTIRPPWWNCHKAYDEGLLSVPSAPRFRRAKLTPSG